MILSIGLTCLDIVNFIKEYPHEDSDHRCSKQSWERGGNASNNASVLADLGAQVEYFGTLANDRLLGFFQDDMNSRGIISSRCPILDRFQTPASVVICSEATGSRTIVHHNGNFPELTVDQFSSNVTIENYSWIHFEGRNENELTKCLQNIQAFNQKHSKPICPSSTTSSLNYTTKQVPVSIEVEKKRESLGALLQFADVVFIGKDFASMRGATNCTHAARIFSSELPKGVLIICPWGETGAAYCTAGDTTENIKKVDAIPPSEIVDSLGAGDTFCAAVIYALAKKFDPEASVRFGCHAASAKLEIFGFKNICDSLKNIPECREILENRTSANPIKLRASK